MSAAPPAGFERTRSAVLSAIRDVLPDGPATFALHEPVLGAQDLESVSDCLRSGYVSSVGEYVTRFEQRLTELHDARHAVAVNTGTAALHLALRVVGVSPGDEVLMPALSFVATANAASYLGAIPHFVDIDARTLGVDAGALDRHLERIAGSERHGLVNRETGRRIAALVPMHTFGHPVDLPALLECADRFGLPVVEDAAEALGSRFRGRALGTFGTLAALSFNGNKIVTTGGGGAILTDDDAPMRAARHLSTTAKLAHQWAYRHDEVAYNYRMPNLNAALGCAQLDRLEEFVARKRELASRYAEAFAEVDGVDFFVEPPGARSNYWLNALLLTDGTRERRDSLLAHLHDHGIIARPAWDLLPTLPMFESCPSSAIPVAARVEDSLISLPSSASLVSP